MFGLDRIIAICVIIALFLIGFINVLRDVKLIGQRKQFAYEFLEELGKYLQSEGRDYEIYAWLIHRSNKMQSDLGELGILQAYSPPYANYIYNNYPMVLNILPQIRKEFEDNRIMSSGRIIREYGALLNEAILRYIGVLDDLLEVSQKELRNPLIWLREGTQQILIFPLSLLKWFGIIGESIVQKVMGNVLFKLFAGIIALLSLLGTIITIVTGWSQFFKTIQGIMQSL